MRAINLRPDRPWRIALALLPFLRLSARLHHRLGNPARRKSERQAAAELRDMGETHLRLCLRGRSAHRRLPAVDRHGASLDAAAARALPSRRRSRLCVGIAHRPAARSWARTFGAVRRGAVDGAAARTPADPVHRHGARRSLEDHADRHRHVARSSSATSRSRVGDIPREQLIKAQTLGASTCADRLARRAAADPAAAHRFRSAGAWPGLAVPDRGRGDRRRLGPRLPHLPRAPLSRRWT